LHTVDRVPCVKEIDRLYESEFALVEIDSEIFVMLHQIKADSAVDTVESGDIDVDHREIEWRG